MKHQSKISQVGLLVLLCGLFVQFSLAQIAHVEPPNWWVGMENSQLQVLVHGKNISAYTPSITYEGVTLKKSNTADSPNYLFLDLEISKTAQFGEITMEFKAKGKRKLKHKFELKAREKKASDYLGFNSTDVIYLITPDRFANGNPDNDIKTSLREKKIDRSHDYARHGGDIAGITQHLDYISDMGFTAIWSSPLLTNDMVSGSYHGYAITDYYQVDPRFGTLEEYINLSKKAEGKGMKLIMDQVANHCGLYHWWMEDLPFKDWVNYQEIFEAGQQLPFSNHRRTVNQDSYASAIDKKEMSDGWFVNEMPDLNQRNPYMANYIIQNSIWWIETLCLGGIRQDTYPYPDKAFMANWAGAILKEYPNFNIVGEEWSYNPLLIGYWQEGAKNADGYDSNLPSTMDFAMQQNVVEALNEEEKWDTGLIKMYEGLANDFYYPNPSDILIFPDNHDMSRIYTQLKGDLAKTKMALGYMLTMPRTPQIYYGTEVLLDDFEKPGDHGLVRTDFPGGWRGDPVDAFAGNGLTKDQMDMQQFLKSLLNFRKNSSVIHTGKTVHFAPKDGVYVWFRENGVDTVIGIINKNEESYDLDLSRFAEMKIQGATFTDVIGSEYVTLEETIKLEGKSLLLLSK